MKAGWQTKKLSQVCEKITDGTHQTPTYFEDGFLFLSSRNVTSGTIDWDNVKYVDAQQHTDMQKRVSPRLNDILLAKNGTTGVAAIVDRDVPFDIYVSLALLRPLTTVLPTFLLHFVNSPIAKSQFTKRLKGIGVPNLHLEEIREVEIAFPESLAEQRRIVGILDEAFEGLATAKANAEQNLQNARALFESHLQAVFTQRGEGWVEKPLSELCDIKHGFAFKSEFFATEGDYVLLTPGNFYEIGGYRDRGEKQKYYAGEIPPDFVLSENDLLVAMTEQAAGLLGSPVLVPESNKFLHNQRLGLVTKKPGIPWTNEFFFHVFNTQAVRKEIHDSATGVKVRHTSPTKIGDVVVSFPTELSRQRKIVATLKDLREETQRLESLYQRKLAKLDELKKSLLHRAFVGEL